MGLHAILDHGDGPDVHKKDLADLLASITMGRKGKGASYAELEEPAERLLLAIAGESLVLVAGAGFEPTTFGL